MLKLSKLLFLCCSILFIGACGGDDDVSPTGGNDSIVGEWTVTSFDFEAQSASTFSGSTTMSTTALTGKSMNYDLTITDTDYSTSGGYTLGIFASAGGTMVPVADQSYTNITGSGTYTTEGSTFISNGALFDVSVNGVSTSVGNGQQSAEFVINADGNLVFSQNETSESNANGVTTVTTTTSSSVWTRK